MTMVTTEGTRVETGRPFTRLIITARGKAADGMDLSLWRLSKRNPSTAPQRRPDSGSRGKGRQESHRSAARPARRSFCRPRYSYPDAPPAFSSTRFSATAWKATARRTKPKARPSPRASASRCCPISSRWFSTPPAQISTASPLNGWYDYDDEGVKARRLRRGRQRHAEDVPDVALARSRASPIPTATDAGSRDRKWSRASRT